MEEYHVIEQQPHRADKHQHRGNYHALADVIMQAIEDPENSNKMRAAGYAEAVSYDNKEYARKITEVYRSMIR